MGYVGKGLGRIDRSKYAIDSKAVTSTSPKSVTDEVARGKEWEANFLASLPRCVDAVTRQPTNKYLYTNPDGVSYCTSDPIRAYLIDHGIIKPAATGTVTMPLLGSLKDNQTIPGIREGYLDLLLKAQGDEAGRVKASNMGVDWDLRKFGFDYAWNPKNPPKRLTASEMRFAKGKMRQDLAVYDYLDPALAHDNPDVEKGIRMSLAVSAHNFAMEVDGFREKLKENTSEHRASVLQQMCMSFPAQYQECCIDYAQKRGMTEAKIQEAFNKGEFNDCMAASAAGQAAARNRTMMLVVGGVAAVLVGAAALKGRKK